MSIQELVNLFAKRKQEEKQAKDACAQVANEVKNYMQENLIETMTYGGWRVTYKPTEKVSMNEEKLIEVLKKLARKQKDKEVKQQIKSAIRKVEVIDEDVLESLIYNGVIDSADIEQCCETKVTYTLRLLANKR